jgi:hypothetical protein
MKRTLLVTLLSGFLFTQSHAQISKITDIAPKVDLGLKIGLNMQQLSAGSDFQNSYKSGIFGGAFVGVHKNKIGVQVEALVKGVSYELNVPATPISSGGTSKLNAVYLDIPLLFEYRIVKRVWLQLGPQYSIMMSAKNASGNDVKNAFKSSDFAGVIGLDVHLPVRLSAGARYVLGFSDINNTSSATESWKNRSIQLYLAYRIL